MLERLFPQQADDRLVVEDVFSTWLYTGNGGTQTIPNGIDLAGKGGLVWSKDRPSGNNHSLFDSVRGFDKIIFSNSTSGQIGPASYYPTPQIGGGYTVTGTGMNGSGVTFVNWTFREAPKFFDIVTWTGTGVVRDIPHSLGVAPGMIIIKKTNAAQDWTVYHRSTGPNYNLVLNNTAAAALNSGIFPRVTSTSFGIDYVNDYNAVGSTYVAYLFAHDPSADGIIQCGSVTATTGQATVTLGWEPQWVLVKQSNAAGQNWIVNDVMRNMSVTSATDLQPSSSSAEQSPGQSIAPTATGFTFNASYFGSGTYIYIAIRRGPMRTPTLGTSVFQPFVNYTSIANQINGTIGPIDMTMQTQVPTPLVGYHFTTFDRLRGSVYLRTSETAAEIAGAVTFDTNIGVRNGFWFSSGGVGYNFRRAPGFMDVVCYTGDGTYGTTNHNLGVTPELIITKSRSTTEYWAVDRPNGDGYGGRLNSSAAWTANWGPPNPVATSTIFAKCWDSSNVPYVAYLFASAPGVSKVGSYTGNGSSQTINCAFTTGARFVLIKRKDSAGDWYVWDSARGIVAGNDPYLALNSTAAEVTTNDSVDTDSTGFVVNQVAASNINVNGGTYIFLAIA